jgi:hypothetical protein
MKLSLNFVSINSTFSELFCVQEMQSSGSAFSPADSSEAPDVQHVFRSRRGKEEKLAGVRHNENPQ